MPLKLLDEFYSNFSYYIESMSTNLTSNTAPYYYGYLFNDKTVSLNTFFFKDIFISNEKLQHYDFTNGKHAPVKEECPILGDDIQNDSYHIYSHNKMVKYICEKCGKEFTQITKDHSVVQELIDAGKITEAEDAVHKQRSVLTNVLMGHGNITSLLIEYDVKAGDKFLICSDGLTNVVSNSEINQYMSDPDAISKLISLTYERGAPDNITVVIAEAGNGDTGTEFLGAAK